MRKYTLALLLLPACLVYACGGGDDSANPDEDGGADASTTDSTIIGQTDGSKPGDATVADTSTTDGTVASKDGGTEEAGDASKDAGEDAGDGFDGNYPFPIPEAGTVSLQFAGDDTTSFYFFLDGVQWVPAFNQLVLSDPDNGNGIAYTYAIDAAAPVQFPNAALNANIPIGNGIVQDAGFVTCLSFTGTVELTPFDGGAASTTKITGYNGHAFNQPNDVVVASTGNIYITDPDFGDNNGRGEPQNMTGIYVAYADGGVAPAIPQDPANHAYNGIALSPDQKSLYITVSDLNQVRKYPILANGTLDTVNVKLFTFPGTGDAGNTLHGSPDGLAVDDAGNVYVAVATGVEVYNSAGTYLGFISVAAGRMVSSIGFGGPDRKTLFIAAQNGGGDDGKSALYRMYMNVPGGPTK